MPVADWRTYLKYHFLANAADVLPKAFDDEAFDFYGKHAQRPAAAARALEARGGCAGRRARRGGRPALRRKVLPAGSEGEDARPGREPAQGLRAARAAASLDDREDTKKVALEKLATFRPKIGYPDKWRDYSELEVRAGDAFGNATRARVFNWHRDADRLGQPTDRDEWGMTPHTVNAYYNPTFNEIVFPAAILQPPFFDPNADAAVNYGAIGGVIGHEMGHGFDDQGSKSDAKGVLRTWWQPADEKCIQEARRQSGRAVRRAIEALPGLKVNGRLTLGENIGDLGGLSVALAAYRLSLDGKPAPVLDGLTGDQRFFLSWAQAWRTNYREQRLRNQVMSDPHSPAPFRVNGVVRNMDDWYAAFDVQAGRCAVPGAGAARAGSGERRTAEVSQADGLPSFRPRWNQVMRCSARAVREGVRHHVTLRALLDRVVADG